MERKYTRTHLKNIFLTGLKSGEKGLSESDAINWFNKTYPLQYHAEKQRTDDRELLIRFVEYQYDKFHYGSKKNIPVFVDEFLSSQIPAKENQPEK